MKLVFIRHGDPNYEIDSLTERGWKEAEALAKRVARWDVDDFYVSPLGRAQDTAKVSLDAIGRTAETLDWLREFYIEVNNPVSGEKQIPWDFMPSLWTKYEDLYDKDKWHQNEIMKTGNVTEGYKKVCDGIDALLEKYGYIRNGRIYETKQGNDKTMVFFCHLGVQFVVLSHLLGMSAAMMWHNFFVAPTSVTWVETEEREKGIANFRCKKLGDTSHLYIAGITPSDSGYFPGAYQ
ncbi:MAG: histidine phosphatase family protein [Clostridia bacterium]|nr:histidine phosphatase family protein [Clostridia bacterium]